MSIPGNLLPDNVSSAETSTSGWTATGGTLSRVSGVLAPGGGSYILRVSSAGTGDSVLTTTDSYPVVAGTDYCAYMWVHETGRTATFTASVVWLDSVGATISTSSQAWTLGPSEAFAWRVSVQGTAPVGAVNARLEFRATNTAAGNVSYFDVAYLGPPPNHPGNLLSYDDFSSEGGLAAWTSPDGTFSRSYLASGSQEGSMTAKFTPSAAMVCTLELGGSVPVVAGQLYTYTTYAIVDNYPVADPNRSVTFRPFVSWRDSTGAEVEPPRKEVWGSTSAADPGFPYVVYDLQTTAPPGATSAVLLAEIDHTSTTATAYYLDRTSFVESEPNYVLTSHPDEGFISLDIPLTPPTEEDLLTVWRVSPDGSRTPIRSYAGDVDRIPYVMGEYLSFEDYEAPAGEEVWYWIEWRNSSDIVSRYYISTRTITAPAPADPTYVWVKSPGLPALNTSAQVVAPVAWSRAARESRYDIVGRSSPVVRTDTRASRVGTLQLYAWTTADYEALSDLLTAGLPVLIQAHQGRGMDGNLYAAVGDATSDPIEGPPDDPSWIWSLKLTEIDRPSGALQGSAGRTWDDVEDLDAWADLMDTYDSWQAVLTG